MLILEQLDVGAPVPLVQQLRHSRPIASAPRESARLTATQPAPHRILPVRRVEHDLPHVVPARPRPPGRLARLESADGAPQGGPMPRRMIEALIDQSQQHPELAAPPRPPPPSSFFS